MFKIVGISLIEVLVSLLILSMALLGFDVFQLDALHKARDTYYFTLASEQLYSMREWLQVHPISEWNDRIYQWNQENESLLPFGKGAVETSKHPYQVTLFWGQKTSKKICRQLNEGLLHCLSMEVVL